MCAILINVAYIFLVFNAYTSNALTLSDNQREPYPDKIFIAMAEGMTIGQNDDGIKTGYRMWTAPSLKEMKKKIHVNSLEVHPSRIELKVGRVYSLKNLRVIARDADGQIVEHVPIFLDYSQYVLCYDDCNQGWEEIEPRVIEIENRYDEADLMRGLRPGRVELRIQSLSRPDGTCPAAYVDLVVE